MFVIVAGRGQGKTSALAEWFFENPGYRGIIVANESIRRNTVRELARKAVELNMQRIDAKWLTTYVVAASNGFSTKAWLRGHQVREWAIDDTDQVLQVLFGVPIEYVTMTATLVPRPANAQVFTESHTWKEPTKDYVDVDFEEGTGGEPESHRALPAPTKSIASSTRTRSGRNNRLDVPRSDSGEH